MIAVFKPTQEMDDLIELHPKFQELYENLEKLETETCGGSLGQTTIEKLSSLLRRPLDHIVSTKEAISSVSNDQLLDKVCSEELMRKSLWTEKEKKVNEQTREIARIVGSVLRDLAIILSDIMAQKKDLYKNVEINNTTKDQLAMVLENVGPLTSRLSGTYYD